jgi:ketosteroid isomerase-like protein
MTSKLNLQGRVPFAILSYARFFVEKLTPEEVRKTVHLFWTTFLAKSEDVLNSYYTSGSSVFQISMARSEPGRLGAMRRSREYFRPDTRMDLKLGPIEIALIGEDAAVATYTFHFEATGRDLGGGKRVEEKLEIVRATHVFQRDAKGRLLIIHEHFSVPVA